MSDRPISLEETVGWCIHDHHPVNAADLRTELARLREVEELSTAITADALSPWGSSDSEDHWRCDYCMGRCDEISDAPGDWGHTADCAWMALRRELHPASVEALLDRRARRWGCEG